MGDRRMKGFKGGVKDFFYDISVKLTRKNKKNKSHTAAKREALIFYVCILAIPILQCCVFYLGTNVNTIALAFEKYDFDGGRYVFNGFRNFKDFFADLRTSTVLSYAVKNSLTLYLAGVCIGLPLNLIFAFFLYKKVPGTGFFRVVLFLPQILSGIVTSVMFAYFVEGALPALFAKMGAELPDLLNGPDYTFTTIVFYCIWSGFGAQLIIYGTSMSGVDESLIEAGKLDGLSTFGEFFKIVLPMIFPTVTTYLVIGIAGFFTNQASLYNFYGQNAQEYAQTLGYYLFVKVIGSTATLGDYPTASAAGLLFTCIAAPLTILVKYLLERFGPSVE